MKFKVEMSNDNAAFDGDVPGELARILSAIIVAIEDGDRAGACRDINGNTVGKWSLT